MIENETNNINTNIAIIAGKVEGEYKFYHEILSEKFMTIDVHVKRNSEITDTLPVVISEKLLDEKVLNSGFLKFTGQIRSYNRKDRSVETYLFVKDVEVVEPETYINTVELKGVLCKKGQYKVTHSNRKISNFILVIKRNFNKFDYLPIIAWGKDAKYILNQEISTKLSVNGRFQSRKYIKKDNDDNTIEKITYEISSSQIIAINPGE